jgi:guanylate kinase
MTAQLFMITAPSGAGKTSIVRAVLERMTRLSVSISHTTRPMRPADRDGVDYHFVTPSQFDDMIADGQFLEHARVFDNQYGTSRKVVDDMLAEGTDVLLEIDWQGAAQVREIAEVCSVFILPPTLDILRQRLTDRASDSDAVIERRMRDAVDDMSHFRQSDFVVINEDFDCAVDEVCSIITAQRVKLDRQLQTNGKLLHDLVGSG